MMHFVDQAKFETKTGLRLVRKLKLGSWLGLETQKDGQLAVWAEIKSSFFGLERSVKEKIGFIPENIGKELFNDIRQGKRVRARLIDMRKHYQSRFDDTDSVSVSIWSD